MKIVELKAYPDGRAVKRAEKPGIGVEVDEEFLVKHPVIGGPSYV